MAGLSTNVRVRLSVMMFLQYAYNGIWFIPLGFYLGNVGYSDLDIGAAYGTFAVGCIIAPFFVGMIADKFFAAQKVLGVLNLASAGLLLAVGMLSVAPDGKAHMVQTFAADGTPQMASSLGVLYWLLLAHFLCYMPTWALTNTISLRQMDNAARQFPSIRVMGTIGWVVVSAVCLFGPQVTALFGAKGTFEATVVPIFIGAGIGVIAGLSAFFMPDTPPGGKGKQITFADILGIKALGLFKDWNYLVFALTSFFIMFAGLFHWSLTNRYLNESKMDFAQFWQSTGQMAETIFLVAMPWFFKRFGVKKMLLLGLCAWIARFVCYSYGVWGTGTAALVVMGLVLHGPCYDFFFVTGQLYTDKKASKDIQAQAQGLISLLTFGLGWFFGAWLSGAIADKFAVKTVVDGVEKVTNHDWHTVWLCPIGIVAVIIVFFSLFFRDNTSVGHEEKAEEAAPAEAKPEAAHAEVPARD